MEFIVETPAAMAKAKVVPSASLKVCANIKMFLDCERFFFTDLKFNKV